MVVVVVVDVLLHTPTGHCHPVCSGAPSLIDW